MGRFFKIEGQRQFSLVNPRKSILIAQKGRPYVIKDVVGYLARRMRDNSYR